MIAVGEISDALPKVPLNGLKLMEVLALEVNGLGHQWGTQHFDDVVNAVVRVYLLQIAVLKFFFCISTK